MNRILIATSNAGKLRDFAGAAAPFGIEIANIPNFASLPAVVEDGQTFEENARKKAESYSRETPGEIVPADAPHLMDNNTDDEANNTRLLRELKDVAPDKRTGRFVCVIAVARDGQTLQVFRGEAEGTILNRPRGMNGFGYDPLFYFPQIQKSFAELTPEEKAQYSHRGAAFRLFLTWYQAMREQV